MRLWSELPASDVWKWEAEETLIRGDSGRKFQGHGGGGRTGQGVRPVHGASVLTWPDNGVSQRAKSRKRTEKSVHSYNCTIHSWATFSWAAATWRYSQTSTLFWHFHIAHRAARRVLKRTDGSCIFKPAGFVTGPIWRVEPSPVHRGTKLSVHTLQSSTLLSTP